MLEKTSRALIEIYKEERMAHRDELVQFPKFRQWKKEYIRAITSDDAEATEALKEEVLVDPVQVTEVQLAPKKESKMDAAHRIYQEIVNENAGKLPARKDVMTVFQEELGMSAGYASTAHNTVKQRFIK